MVFFTTFTAISLSLNLCFNGHGYVHNVKPYINKRTVCRQTILASLTEMKKFNSLVVAHLSPDVFHLGTELHTQVGRVLNSGCNDYGTADHSSDNLYLPFPVSCTSQISAWTQSRKTIYVPLKYRCDLQKDQ